MEEGWDEELFVGRFGEEIVIDDIQWLALKSAETILRSVLRSANELKVRVLEKY